MNEPTDALLLASIAGALDPGRDLELAELAPGPHCRPTGRLAAAVRRWRRAVADAPRGGTDRASSAVQPMLSMEAGAAIRAPA